MLLQIKVQLRSALFYACVFVTAATTMRTSGQTNMNVVAVVLGEEIHLSVLDPPATLLAEKKKHLDMSAYQGWLLDQRASALLRYAESILFARYAETAEVSLSERDIQEYLVMQQRASGELRGIITQKIAAVKLELAINNLSEERRRELSNRLSILASHPLAGSSTQESANHETKQVEKACLFLHVRNINRELYRQYGGRVLLSSLGYATPIDARRDYLLECEQRGDLKIFDNNIRQKIRELICKIETGDIVEGIAAERAMSEKGLPQKGVAPERGRPLEVPVPPEADVPQTQKVPQTENVFKE